MAENDETVDPNDLDSIDALLDEAERDAPVEGSGNLEASDEGEEQTPVTGEGDGEQVEPSSDAVAEDDLDSLLEEAEDMVSSDETPGSVLDEDDMETPSMMGAGNDNQGMSRRGIQEDQRSEDDFLSRRAAAQTTNSKLTAAEMEEIKKHITVFGSVLIVLLVAAIGVGIWAAVAASAPGVDEETRGLIEATQVRSEMNGNAILESGKSVKAMEKKFDALHHQFEQIIADIAKIEESTAALQAPVVMPVASMQPPVESTKSETKEQKAPMSQPMMRGVGVDPALVDKMSEVNKKLITAQRRIDEVNKRVKSVQTQYKALLHSVKNVEKQMVLEQTRKAEEEEAARKAKEEEEKQSSDAMYYEQSGYGAYP